MAGPGEPTGTSPTGQPTPAPGVGQVREPFALRFAWLIVAIAAVTSIGLVALQLGLDWPFGPTRKTTTTQTLDRDGKVIELTTSEADGGGARDALFRAVAG